MADAITSTGASAATGAAAKTAGKGIAQNFDSFLLLLTTQLRNQSPLDPLDTNQFTQQLVQFASVEQQLKSNETLSALLTSVKASTTSNAASFIGMQVTADGATSRLSNGSARWVLDAARNASQATITIRDKSGGLVATRTRPACGRGAGLHLGRPDLDRVGGAGRRLHHRGDGDRQRRPGRLGQDRDRRPGRRRRHDPRHPAAHHRFGAGAARQRKNPRSARGVSPSFPLPARGGREYTCPGALAPAAGLGKS
jgi:hypothetical protein